MAGQCGTCTACCRVFALPQLNKPAGRWCQHCNIGVGCKIYEDRPPVCVVFTCMWLQAHIDGYDWPDELRPDRCKIVFSPSTDDTIIQGTTMPGYPDAWAKGIGRKAIDKIVKGGFRVVVGQPNSTHRIMLDQNGMHEVQMTEPDENGMQWNIPEHKWR